MFAELQAKLEALTQTVKQIRDRTGSIEICLGNRNERRKERDLNRNERDGERYLLIQYEGRNVRDLMTNVRRTSNWMFSLSMVV